MNGIDGDQAYAFLLVVVLAVSYWFPIRRWFGRWGTTPADLARVMSGDAAIVNPTYATTLAITVSARPEDIWPCGSSKWGISAAGCTATTGLTGCSDISMGRARTASSRNFSTWPSAMKYQLAAAVDFP